MDTVNIIEADLAQPEHQQAVVEMTNAYSLDPRANGRPLTEEVRQRLVPALREHPTTLVLLAYDGDRPVGIATCFRAFSTFAARPHLNVHDLSVIADYRGRGVGRRLLEAVEHKARELGCCQVTLEVFEHNPARRLYETVGYETPNYQASAGFMLYLRKLL